MKNILISICAAILVVVIALNTPASFWSIGKFFRSSVFGNVGYTALTSTDNLADFPSLWNTTLTAFDNGKTDSASTSVAAITTLTNLITVGALSSGSLASGFTPVTVPLGGTGSTTLSQYAVLLGSSTNAISMVNGLGTSGQLLTSGGAGAKPSWTSPSVNTAIAYTWTAQHDFTCSTCGIFATNASTTNATTTRLSFTGILSSLLKTNSNGEVIAASASTDYQAQRYVFSTTTDLVATASSFSTSTLLGRIPANVINASSTIEVHGGTRGLDAGGDGSCYFYLRDTTGATILSGIFTSPLASKTFEGGFAGQILLNGSASAQTYFLQAWSMTSAVINAEQGGVNTNNEGTATFTLGSGISLYTVLESTGAGLTCTLHHVNIVVEP